MTTTDLAGLPEVGWRATWYDDAGWRDFLLATPDSWQAGYQNVTLDGAVTELALHLYHQGLFVLPRNATPAELLEAAAERAVEPQRRPRSWH
jgi:hypothetical protein